LREEIENKFFPDPPNMFLKSNQKMPVNWRNHYFGLALVRLVLTNGNICNA